MVRITWKRNLCNCNIIELKYYIVYISSKLDNILKIVNNEEYFIVNIQMKNK